MPQGFYEEDEAEEILRLAARKPTAGGMSREKLLSTAAELGITPEAVEEAERTLAADREQAALRKEDEARRVAYDRHVKGKFYSDFAAYLLICGALAGLNLYQTHGQGIGWSIWVIVFFGLKIVGEFTKTFLRRSSEYEKGFENWKGRLSPSSSSDQESPSDVAREYLAHHPGAAINATREVRDRFGLSLEEAHSVVKSVQD